MTDLNYFEDRDEPSADALDVRNWDSVHDMECGYGACYSIYRGSWPGMLSLGNTGSGHGRIGCSLANVVSKLTGKDLGIIPFLAWS